MTKQFEHPIFNNSTKFTILEDYNFVTKNGVGELLKGNKIIARLNNKAAKTIEMISQNHPLQHIIKNVTMNKKDIDNLLKFLDNMIQLGFLKLQGESS